MLKSIRDILVFTECRLNPKKTIPFFNNYTYFATTKHLNQNDGVVIYIKFGTNVLNVKETKLDHALCLQVETNDSTILGISRYTLASQFRR